MKQGRGGEGAPIGGDSHKATVDYSGTSGASEEGPT